MKVPNPQQTSEKQLSTLPLDVVRVGGRYRVGKLLGTGGSGELNSDLSRLRKQLTNFSGLFRECLSRKRH